MNGHAIREALAQWWYDASAKALSEGYRDYTKPAGISGSVKQMEYSGLIPGDMAVTSNGVHVLVYLGEEQWIQAEPLIKKVITLNGWTDKNSWFAMDTNIHRWQILEP